MRYLLAFLMIFMLAVPVEARHLCVMEMNDKLFVSMWPAQHPDVMVVSKDWRYLDEFLKKAQDKFGNDDEELILDISCHGCASNGMLYQMNGQKTSMGSVLKRVEDFFPNRPNMTLIMESCFCGRCYKLTSRGDDESYLPGGITQPPPFPVLGIDDTLPNCGNLQYLSYINHDKTFQVDVREYETKPLSPFYYNVDLYFLYSIGQKMFELLEKLTNLHTL